MSRSNPPRSPTAGSPRDDDPPAADRRSSRRRLAIRFAAFIRWVHIYVSMFGLAAVLFFGVTGLTLNHPRWFFEAAERTVRVEGRIEPGWLHVEATGGESDPSRQVAKLEIVEFLRKAHGVRGALAEFRSDEGECLVAFKGPGYAADAFIDRESGRYQLTQTDHGFIAIINDLHKGRDTGPAWSLVIDISAVLLTIISLSGLVLLFYLKLRRGPGLAVALIGTAVVVAVIRFWVP